MNIKKKSERSGHSATQTASVARAIPRWQRSSLKARITAFAIAASTIPVLGTAAIEFWHDDQLLNDRLVKDQETTTLLLADSFSRFMFERYGDVKVLSTKGILSDPQLSAETPLRQKQEILNRFVQIYGVYDNVSFADLTGRILVEVGVSSGEGMGDTDYFKKVIQTKQVVITTPKLAKVTGLYSTIIAAPVFENGTNNKLIGVVSTRVPIEKIEALLIENNPNLEQGDHLFIDENGTIFGAEKHQELGVPAAKTFAGFAELSTQNRLKTATLTSSINGEQILASYSPLRQLAGGPELPWKLALVQSAKGVQEARWQWWLISLASTGLTAIAVGTIAALFARRIIAPVVEAALAAQQLGQGKLDTRLPVQGQDELAILGTNLNQMADQLQTLLQQQQAKTEDAQFLKKITLHLSKPLQPEEKLKQVVHEVRQQLKCDRVLVVRFTQPSISTPIAESVGTGWAQALNVHFHELYTLNTVSGFFLDQPDQILSMPQLDQTQLKPSQFEQLEQLDVRSQLVAAIRVDCHLFGLLVAHQCGATREWQPLEINLFAQVATQVGLAWDRALEGLGPILSQFKRSTTDARSAVEANEQTMQQLTTQTVQQVEKINEVLESVEQGLSVVQPIAQQVTRTSTVAQSVLTTAEAGKDSMERAVGEILTLRERVAHTTKQVKHLGESSQQIAAIVASISRIAKRTSLLAMNTNLKMTCAGEGESGWSGIATEVGELAKELTLTTEQLEHSVQHIRQETSEVAQSMDLSTGCVVEGTHLIEETKRYLEQLLELSTQVHQSMQPISTALEVQGQQSQSLTALMKELVQVSEQTSTNSQQIARSLQHTIAGLHQLQHEIDGFGQ